MNDAKPKASIRHPLAVVVFYIISIVLLPVTLLGYIIYIAYIFIAGRTPGVSLTAQGPLSARFVEHQLGVREDEAASRLMTVLPGTPPLGIYLVVAPTLLAHRLTGYVPKAFRYPYEGEVEEQYEASARQTFFDHVVDRHLPDIKQFIILGAGFDTRAFRLPKGTPVRSFEVDAPTTQAVKRAMLGKAEIDSTGVTFVPDDFEKEDWLAKLVASGFRPDQPALFLWEGVVMYLDRQAVEDTLRKIAGTAKGSILAFDYFTTEPLTSGGLYWRYGRMTTKAAGEPLTFGIDSTPPLRDRLAEFVSSCGLSLVDHRTLGQDTDGKRAWGGFATATVK